MDSHISKSGDSKPKNAGLEGQVESGFQVSRASMSSGELGALASGEHMAGLENYQGKV